MAVWAAHREARRARSAGIAPSSGFACPAAISSSKAAAKRRAATWSSTATNCPSSRSPSAIAALSANDSRRGRQPSLAPPFGHCARRRAYERQGDGQPQALLPVLEHREQPGVPQGPLPGRYAVPQVLGHQVGSPEPAGPGHVAEGGRRVVERPLRVIAQPETAGHDRRRPNRQLIEHEVRRQSSTPAAVSTPAIRPAPPHANGPVSRLSHTSNRGASVAASAAFGC